jgi:hypothetical protein
MLDNLLNLLMHRHQIFVDKILPILCINMFPLLHGTKRGVVLGSVPRRILEITVVLGVRGAGGTRLELGVHLTLCYWSAVLGARA